MHVRIMYVWMSVSMISLSVKIQFWAKWTVKNHIFLEKPQNSTEKKFDCPKIRPCWFNIVLI